MADVVAKFISQKISKTRWRPSSNRSLLQSDIFASGSWDDEENKVCLWQIPSTDISGDEFEDTESLERDPRLLCEATHAGDVTGLEFTSAEHIVVSSSTGSVTLYKHHRNTQTLMVACEWSELHYDPDESGCPCTCVCTQGEDMIVTGGEDGRINVLNVSSRKPVRTIDLSKLKGIPDDTLNVAQMMKFVFEKAKNIVVEGENSHYSGLFSKGLRGPVLNCLPNDIFLEWTKFKASADNRLNLDKADSCTVNAVTFLKQVEVITVNSCGQLKIFDLRNTQDEPVKNFCLSGEQTPLHCVSKHPSQHHIVATGGKDGLLTIWDMRQDKYPVTLLEAHSAAMLEVKFHPDKPDHLFSCSEDGSVWHWDASSVASLVTGTGAGSGGGSMFTHHTVGSNTDGGLTSPWLSLEAGRHKMEINTLLPNQTLAVNTLDIESQTLVCGTDMEAIYTVVIPGLR